MGNRLLKGIAALSAAAAICFGCSTVRASAEAKAFDPQCVTIDYENQELIVEQGLYWYLMNGQTKDLTILFGVSTVKTTKGVSKLTTPSWEVYEYPYIPSLGDDEEDVEGKQIHIDISTLNRTKDNYVQIKGNKYSEPLTIKIPAVDSNLKAKYDPMEGALSITTKKNQEADLDDSVEWEYRTQYSGWQSFDIYGETDIFKKYQQRGAALYVRTKASKKTVLNADAEDDSAAIVDAQGKALTVLSGGSFPGVELKFSVPKLSNAPKVTLDYVKGTVSIPRGAQYRVIPSGTEEIDDWTETDEDVKTTVLRIDSSDELEALREEGGSLEVVTPETDTKPASKIGHWECNPLEKIYAVAQGDNGLAFATGATSAADSKIAAVRIENNVINMDESYVTAALVKGKNGKYTVTFTNRGLDAYEIYLQDSEDLPEPGTKAAKKIAAATAAKPQQQLKMTNIAEGKNIFIRKVGNKANGTWTTEYVCFGAVK